MELFVLLVLAIPYLVIRYFYEEHETPHEKNRQRFRAGLIMLEKKEYEAAHLYFTERLKQEPREASLHLWIGICLFRLGEPIGALASLRQASTYDNTLYETPFFAARCHVRLGETEAALREYDKAVWHSRGEVAEVLRMRGEFLFRNEYYLAARSDWEKAALLGDENAAYYLRRHFNTPIRLRS